MLRTIRASGGATLLLLLGLLVSKPDAGVSGSVLRCIPVEAECCESLAGQSPAQARNPSLNPKPRVWDEDALRSMELPLADASLERAHMSAREYYAQPIRPVYRSYPIYHPDHEPAGYIEQLRQREPGLAAADCEITGSEEAILRCGEQVFQAPLGYDSDPFAAIITFAQTRDRGWYERVGVRWEKRTGVMPYARYVIREKGKVEVGNLACAMCHTRVLDDGTVVLGAQGNFGFDRSIADTMRTVARQVGNEKEALQMFRAFDTMLFGAPWRRADPLAPLGPITLEKYIALSEAIPPGVLARTGTSPLLPVQIPDLIGVASRKYLDRTGLVRHRGIEDLMRYAALNQGAELATRYGDFVPAGPGLRELPPGMNARYSDGQLHALARYIYSLQAPPNPNLPQTEAQKTVVTRGEAVFERLGCGRCHRPPLYTNNRLTPVDGFTIPPDHLERFDVIELSLGTDPGLSIETRRGTGYYKVPSLLGIWYRGPFEHNGSAATLEDWFDPQRLSEKYVPTGWKGPPGTDHRAVRGHLFGLNLTQADRAALIAFLRTL